MSCHARRPREVPLGPVHRLRRGVRGPQHARHLLPSVMTVGHRHVDRAASQEREDVPAEPLTCHDMRPSGFAEAARVGGRSIGRRASDVGTVALSTDCGIGSGLNPAARC